MENKKKLVLTPETHTRQYWYEESEGFYQTKSDCGCNDLKTKVNKNTSTNKKQTDDLKNIQEGLKNIQLVKKQTTDNSIVYSFTNSSKKEITFEIPTSFEDIYLEKAEYDDEKKVIVFTLVNGTTLTLDPKDMMGEFVKEISGNVETLMANSAHTIVEGDDTYIKVEVQKDGITYKVSADEDAIKSLISDYLTENNYATTGDVINIVSGVSGDVETLKENSGHTTVSAGDNVTVTQSGKNYQVSVDLSEYAKTSDLSGVIDTYLTENNYATTGDVINIVSGISGDVETLKANSGHTTVSASDNIIVVTPSNGKPTDYAISVDIDKLSEELDQTHTTVTAGDNVTVAQTNKNYKVSVPNSAITNVAKSSVKVINGTNTTVTEGADGDVKTFAVNVDLSEYAKSADVETLKANSGHTTVTAGDNVTVTKSNNDYQVSVDLSEYAKSADIPTNYITSGTIGASADGYSAKVEGGTLKLTIPETAAPHIYKGDNTYITVTSDDTITFNADQLPIAISSVSATYGGTAPSGSFENGVLTISYPEPEGSITSGSITSSTNGYSATVENKTLKLTVPEVKALTGTSVSASNGYSLTLSNDKTQLDFTYPNAEVYSAEKKVVAYDKAVNLSADTTSKKYVLDYPDFTTVTPQSDFGTSQDNYGQITTAVTTNAQNGQIGKAVETIEKSISGTQQVLVDDELIFEKAVENMAKASGLLFDNIIKYVPYTEIDTCIKSATSLYTAQVELAKEVRNLWVAFNDIKTKLGI